MVGGPLFWIFATYLVVTFGPILAARIQGNISMEEAKEKIMIETPDLAKSVLGTNQGISEEKKVIVDWRDLPNSVQEIPQYIREIIEKTTERVVEVGTTTIHETTEKVSEDVCDQIIVELKKQCKIEAEQ